MGLVRILVSDKLSETGINILKASGLFDVDVKTGMSPTELGSVIGQYDGLIIRSASQVTRDVLASATNLKVVGRAGIGVDNVDVKAASERGVVVMNTPGGNTTTTAEHAIALMLSMARRIPQAAASIKAGKWEKGLLGVELWGKTLGVVGLGRIGSLVAKKAIGLEMKIIAYDPFINAQTADKMGVELVSLDDLYGRSDFITLHCVLTPETRKMLGGEAFAKMKKGVRIINCARGGLVDEDALAEAIRSGKVAGAALDVFEKEPPKDSPIVAMDEVVGTPHLGASTAEAQENVAIHIAEQMVDFFRNGVIQNAVNVPSISPEQFSVVRPYLALGGKLGSFVAQVAGDGPKNLEITYMGEIADIQTAPVTQSIIKGLLEVYVGTTVNFVNAPYLAESRGITISTTKSTEKRALAGLVGVKLKTDSGDVYAEGAVFPGGESRLTKLSGFFMEARLDGTMIVFTNNDKPGVIGAIGTFLGSKGINIASFELSRMQLGGQAMAIINVDSTPSPADLAEMKKIVNVLDVKLVRL